MINKKDKLLCVSFPMPIDIVKDREVEQFDIFTVLDKQDVILQARLLINLIDDERKLEIYPWVKILYRSMESTFQHYKESKKNIDAKLEGILLTELPFLNLKSGSEIQVILDLTGSSILAKAKLLNSMDCIELKKYTNWMNSII